MAYTNEALGKALEDLTAAYNNFIEKAKDAAIAAMGDTVISQIKQDAKDYIAAELAEQKAALEQAIENAKIALHNSAVEANTTLEQHAAEKKNELSDLITAAENAIKEQETETIEKIKKTDGEIKTGLETLEGELKTGLEKTAAAAKTETENAVTQAKEDLKEYSEDVKAKIKEAKEQFDMKGNELLTKMNRKVNRRFIEFFKNGYIQWPGMPAPETLYKFEGYHWEEVDYDGCFFRAKGKDANPFDGEEQGDAIRNIEGSLWLNTRKEYQHLFNEPHSLFKCQENQGATCPEIDALSSSSERTIFFDASRVVPTANENRPRNRTFIIWQLKRSTIEIDVSGVEKIILKASYEEDRCYEKIPIKHLLTEGNSYHLEADFKVTSTTYWPPPQFATLFFFDHTDNKKLAQSRIPIKGSKCRAKLDFIYNYPAGHDVSILCYSGEDGKTKGVCSEYSNFSLTETPKEDDF